MQSCGLPKTHRQLPLMMWCVCTCWSDGLRSSILLKDWLQRNASMCSLVPRNAAYQHENVPPTLILRDHNHDALLVIIVNTVCGCKCDAVLLCDIHHHVKTRILVWRAFLCCSRPQRSTVCTLACRNHSSSHHLATRQCQTKRTQAPPHEQRCIANLIWRLSRISTCCQVASRHAQAVNPAMFFFGALEWESGGGTLALNSKSMHLICCYCIFVLGERICFSKSFFLKLDHTSDHMKSLLWYM